MSEIFGKINELTLKTWAPKPSLFYGVHFGMLCNFNTS